MDPDKFRADAEVMTNTPHQQAKPKAIGIVKSNLPEDFVLNKPINVNKVTEYLEFSTPIRQAMVQSILNSGKELTIEEAYLVNTVLANMESAATKAKKVALEEDAIDSTKRYQSMVGELLKSVRPAGVLDSEVVREQPIPTLSDDPEVEFVANELVQGHLDLDSNKLIKEL